MQVNQTSKEGGMLFKFYLFLFFNVLHFQTPGLDLRVDSQGRGSSSSCSPAFGRSVVTLCVSASRGSPGGCARVIVCVSASHMDCEAAPV